MDAPGLGGEVAADVLGLRLDAAAELGERLLGGRRRAGERRLGRGAGDAGAIRSLVTEALPQTAQERWPAPSSRSKSALDPNQESKRCACSQRSA